MTGATVLHYFVGKDALYEACIESMYQQLGARLSTTVESAFAFDVEGYLVANQGNASVQALVQSLAGSYHSTSQAGFIEAVEQHYLAQVSLVGIGHGGAATAADLNAAFGTVFGA